MTAPRSKRPAQTAPTVAPLEPLVLLDYDGAAQVSGLRPGYVKALCDKRQIPYIIDEFYRGHRRRRVRRIPYEGLRAFLLRRLVPATPQRPPTRRPHGASAP
jgi:hypothetical protein